MKKKILGLLLVLLLFIGGCTSDIPGYGTLVDLDGNVVTIDALSRSNVVVQFEHHNIHEGDNYFYSEVMDLPANNVLDIQITTPNTTQWAHMTAEFEVENETEWWVYENVIINVAGAAVAELNSNRNSVNVNTTQLATITNANIANANADTAIAGATLLFHGIAGAGKKIGGAGSSRQEIILATNEDYTIRFEATAAGYVAPLIRWYEFTSFP